MREADGGMPDLAQRLNHLFLTVPRPDRGGNWTNEQAAAALASQGTPMSDGYISELRNGKKNNPSARNLAAIAELLGSRWTISSIRKQPQRSTPTCAYSLRSGMSGCREWHCGPVVSRRKAWPAWRA